MYSLTFLGAFGDRSGWARVCEVSSSPARTLRGPRCSEELKLSRLAYAINGIVS